MFAIKKDKHEAIRHVMLEKIGYFSDINKYEFEDYDTVKLIRGQEEFKGILIGFGYRGGGKATRTKRITRETISFGRVETQEKIIGYSFVLLITQYSFENLWRKEFWDDYFDNKIIFLQPEKIVLIEKNIISYFEKIRDDFNINAPIIGG